MELNIELMLVARWPIPDVQAKAIRAMSRAYSTKSWPSSLFRFIIAIWSLAMSFFIWFSLRMFSRIEAKARASARLCPRRVIASDTFVTETDGYL